MDLSGYDGIICVAGTRAYSNYSEFDLVLRDYLLWLGPGKYVFISGDAWRGADAMIIQWCAENGYRCEKFPADWDKDGKGAGFIRNRKMRDVCTHLLAFWDGESSGTEEMIDESMGSGRINVTVQFIENDGWKPKPFVKKQGFNKNGWKPKGSRANGVRVPGRYSSW